jgi:hypothetical protein
VIRGGTRRGLSRRQAGSAADVRSSPPAASEAEPSDTSTEDTSPAPVAVEQLRKQCETAARRGDCPAVRRIMGRITQIDRDYHARVAESPAVAKCLADTAH